MSHPSNGLDDVVHQRVRLGILAVLMEAKRVEFRYARDTLELTDGNLSRHLQVLEEAGYIAIAKEFEGRKPRTWIRTTPEGREAFLAEVRGLKAIIGRLDSAAADKGP